jgi:arylsulfatase A-like enzyme
LGWYRFHCSIRTEEVRRNIDWELAERGIDFIKRQKAAGKPFFLYLPVSRTPFPNLPSKRFEGASRIGQFGDSLVEGDAAVGAMLDALNALGLEDNTIVAFASDNGPEGPGARDFGATCQTWGCQDRSAASLGDVSEGLSGLRRSFAGRAISNRASRTRCSRL